MARVEIHRQSCPVCKYVYEIRNYFCMQNQKKPIMTPRDNSQEHINPKDFEPNNTCIYVPNYERKEVIYNTKITQGDEEFKKLVLPNIDKNSDGYVNSITVNTLGMFCPKCGVFLNVDICSSFEKKDLPY